MSANAINDMWLSRQIGPFVVDFYPDAESDDVTLFIWRSGAREAGYRVECKTPEQVRAVVREVEAVA